MADADRVKENLPPNEESAARDPMSQQESVPGADAIPSSPPMIPFSDAPSPTSSEPPIFSSDAPGHMDDLENYASPRNKRKRTGPWWEADPVQDADQLSTAKRGRNMERYDSGVVAYSDEIYPVDLAPEEIKALDEDHLDFVQHLLEGIRTNADCYGYDTGTLRDSHLEHVNLLNQVINPGPDPGREVPADRQYRSMVPDLKLNFRNNLLCHLHINLFSVENLTCLNLSNNNIKELSPQIGRLRNLRSLNLYNNPLYWLPFEFHSLLQPQGNLEMFSFSEKFMPWIERSPPFWGPKRMRMFDESILDDPPSILTNRSWFRYRKQWRTLDDYTPTRVNPDYIHRIWKRFEEANSLEGSQDVPEEWTDYRGPLHRYCCDLLWQLSALEYLERHRCYKSDPDQHILLGCSPVSYYTEGGRLLEGSIDPGMYFNFEEEKSFLDRFCTVPTSQGLISFVDGLKIILPVHASPPPPPSSSAPSLFALCMSQAIRNESPAAVRGLFADTSIPPQVEEALTQAEENEAKLLTALLTCRCGRSFVVPRAMWFEFWMHDWGQRMPYKVQVCSLACAKRFYMQNYLKPEQDQVLARKGWRARWEEKQRLRERRRRPDEEEDEEEE